MANYCMTYMSDDRKAIFRSSYNARRPIYRLVLPMESCHHFAPFAIPYPGQADGVALARFWPRILHDLLRS